MTIFIWNTLYLIAPHQPRYDLVSTQDETKKSCWTCLTKMFHALELLCDMMNYNLKIIAADDHARARSYKVQVKYGDPKNIMCLFKSYKNYLYAKIIFSTKTQCLLFRITYLTKNIYASMYTT